MKSQAIKKPLVILADQGAFKLFTQTNRIRTMTNLSQVVKFNNQDVPVFFYENKPYVAMKPICENIGLDWVSQHKRIQRNHVLNSTMVIMTIVAQDGKNREMVTLPIGFLNGWLAGVDVNKVKPEIKDTLIKYQLECYDVLYKHFMPKVAELHPNTITNEQQQQIKKAVLCKAQRDQRTHQSVYHEFYDVFDVPRYQELPIDKFEAAMQWLNGGFYHKKPTIMDDLHREIYIICMRALSTNKEHIQLLHNINISYHSDTIANAINFIRQENSEILKFSLKHKLQSKLGKPLFSSNGYVEFYHGGGFDMNHRYFM